MKRSIWICALALGLALAAPATAPAANHFKHFFPVENDPFNTIDDEYVVDDVKWRDGENPQWLLIRQNGVVMLPSSNLNNVTDSEILEGFQRALKEWNSNPLSSFTFEDDVFYSDQGLFPNPPSDAEFDGFNSVTFLSDLISLPTGAIAVTSDFYFERDFDVSEFLGVPEDMIESDLEIPLDLDIPPDGLADYLLPARNYKRGELVESDIIFNNAISELRQWPENRGDVPSQDEPFLPGSLDIQATLLHELGHAHGLGHTMLIQTAMYPFAGTEDFPGDPYDQRDIKYDDELAQALAYENVEAAGATNAIKGKVLDGQYVALQADLGVKFEDIENTTDTNALNKLYVVAAPVFLGRPAEFGIQPDVVDSSEGRIRLIAQVYTGDDLRYPAGVGGSADYEPALDEEPNIDLDDQGEDVNGNGMLDPGEDINNNGALDPTTTRVDGDFLFFGMEPREDYVLYIDQNFNPEFTIANFPDTYLGAFESFPPEFYGGAPDSFTMRDTYTIDDEADVPELISVGDGSAPVHVTIITNTDATLPDDGGGGGGTDTPNFADGEPGKAVQFVETSNVSDSNYVPLGADMGDINNDGYPDLVVAVFTGGQDPSNLFNRVYLNVPIDAAKPSAGRFLRDVTFGLDEIPGTQDDVIPPHAENSRDCKLADFNNDGRLDLFVVNASNGLPGQSIGQSAAAAGGFNRLYLNEADAGNGYGFRFRDVSEFALPGLLNRGWGPSNPRGWTNGYHSAVGDIDADGDVDIILSLLTAETDTVYDSLGRVAVLPTIAAIDNEPSAESNSGNNAYDPQPGGSQQGDRISSPTDANGNFLVELYPGEDLNMNEELDHYEDIDFDGKCDVDEDVDMDGRLDVNEDLNNNQTLDPGEDIDLDGQLDVDEDTDGDGRLDITEDLNDNGICDLIEEDVNGNDVLDCPVFGGPLVFSEQVLINRTIDGASPGFRFVDETLGADNRFGDSTNLAIVNPPFNGLFMDFGPNTDRMPPVFPVTNGLDATCVANGKTDSPMGWHAFEPRLGPLWRDGGLDLMSARTFRDQRIPTFPINDAQSAFFQNLDVRTPEGFTSNAVNGDVYSLRDGIADGYFGCLNYGVDFRYRDGSALFPVRVVMDASGTTVTMEKMPLLIGIPDGVTGDIGGTPSEADEFERLTRGAFAGIVGDWEYRGAPKPMLAVDTDYGRAFLYTPRNAVLTGAGLDVGARRGQRGELVSGYGIDFNVQTQTPPLSSFAGPYSALTGYSAVSEQFTTYPKGDGGVTFSTLPIPEFNGEAHSVTSADYNSDGDFDLYVAQNVSIGYTAIGTVIINDPPVNNSLFSNDGFGNFADSSAAIPEALPRLSYVALTADVDNDADKDIVVVNALSSHQVFLNQMYAPGAPPDPKTKLKDSTLFYDQSPEFVPPIYGETLIPPFEGGAYSSITTSVAAADMNADGFPDLVTADGGTYSQGDYSAYLLNVGPKRAEAFRPFSDAQQSFVPAGAPFPGRRILPPYPNPDFNSLQLIPGRNGFIQDRQAANYGVSLGDFSGDGHPDVLFSANSTVGEGPACYVNLDSADAFALALQTGLIPPGVPGWSNETFLNSSPDADSIPDGVLFNIANLQSLVPNLMPDIVDPCPDSSNSIVRKKLGRRFAAADFDGNGTLDVCIANGLENAGAANLMLLNFPQPIFPFSSPLPRFIDATETNLPTLIGDCGQLEGIPDDTYAIAAADFDHDGDIDLIFANQTNFALSQSFPPFRYLTNDGAGVFSDTNQIFGHIDDFANTRPRGLLVCDLDGVGEWTEDTNHNGVLDAGEDYNQNGKLDVSEDANGNGVLDPGEDKDGDGLLDLIDLADEGVAGDVNGDGIITQRADGVWEPSFDVFVSFYNRADELLINDPTNANPSIFSAEGATRLPTPMLSIFGGPLFRSGGARCGDVDLDGDMDIVVAKGNENASGSRGAQFLLNNGTGTFADATHEVPFPKSVQWQGEAPGALSGTGNAVDVELLDADKDGDLDLFVGNAGPVFSLVLLGAQDNLYLNRTIGGNGNIGGLTPSVAIESAAAAPPLVFAVEPSGLVIGTAAPVTVAGKNLQPNSQLDFGPGVTVNGVTFLNQFRMVVDLTIDAQASIGPRAVDVNNPSEGLSSKAATGTFNVLDIPANKVGKPTWQDYE